MKLKALEKKKQMRDNLRKMFCGIFFILIKKNQNAHNLSINGCFKQLKIQTLENCLERNVSTSLPQISVLSQNNLSISYS